MLRVGEMDTSETSFQMLLAPVEVDVPIAIRDPVVPALVDDLMSMKEGK